MFGVICETELLLFHAFLEFRVISYLDVFTLNLLGPSKLVKALTEEYSVRYDNPIERITDLLRKSVKVKSKDFINEHLRSIIISEIVVISTPKVTEW